MKNWIFLLDFFRSSIRLLKLLFLTYLPQNFSTMYAYMLSKFFRKSAQKSLILTIKANFERSLLSALTISCSSTYESSISYEPFNYSGFHLQGGIVEGRYYDPAGYFSVPVMENGYGLKIKECSNKTTSAVTFQNDLGDITQVELIIGFKTEMEKREIPENIKSVFDVLVVRQLEDTFSSVEILKIEEREIENLGPVCLGLVSIPGGATIGDKLTGKQADSTRAYLMTYQGDHLIVISKQEPLFPSNVVMQAILNIDTRQKEDLNNLLLEKVIKLGKSFKICS